MLSVEKKQGRRDFDGKRAEGHGSPVEETAWSKAPSQAGVARAAVIAWGVGREQTGVEAERARTLQEGCAGAGAASPKGLPRAGCSSVPSSRSPVC